MLQKIINEEISIFKIFTEYLELSENAIAFAVPDSEQIMHWNCVYSKVANHKFSKNELDKAQSFYSSLGVKGHLMLIDKKWKKSSLESEEYFYIINNETKSIYHSTDLSEFVPKCTQDLMSFCKILKSAFNLDDKTTLCFYNKMKVFSEHDGNKFWIVYKNNTPCGCASTFLTQSGHNFLFNVGVMPKYQGQNIGSQMVRSVVSMSDLPLYTYSYNSLMQNKILPDSGFKSAGWVYKLLLDTYVSNLEVPV